MRRKADMSKPRNRVCMRCSHWGFYMICNCKASPNNGKQTTLWQRCKAFEPDEKNGGGQ